MPVSSLATANAQRVFCKSWSDWLLAGLAGCLEVYQSSMQVWYLVIQMLMLPIVLLAAYVGWVLPDIYIQKVTQAQAQGVDSFLSTLAFSNPIDEETGNSGGTKEGGDEDLPEASAIAEALIQAKQVSVTPSTSSHLLQLVDGGCKNFFNVDCRLTDCGLATRQKRAGTKTRSYRHSAHTCQVGTSRQMQI